MVVGRAIPGVARAVLPLPVVPLSNPAHFIALVQVFLGLVTGGLLYGSWLELRSLLPTARLPALAFKFVGVALTGAYFFSTATVQFERTLRPEAVFPFCVILQIYCNLRFIRTRFARNGLVD